jgi:hypothetical protein
MAAGDALTVSQLIQTRFDRLETLGSAEVEDLNSPHAVTVLARAVTSPRLPASHP